MPAHASDKHVDCWNTQQMQAALDGWRSKGQGIGDDWLRRLGPAHFAHVNFRAAMSFPIERYRETLLDAAPWRRMVRLSTQREQQADESARSCFKEMRAGNMGSDQGVDFNRKNKTGRQISLEKDDYPFLRQRNALSGRMTHQHQAFRHSRRALTSRLG
ncbi:Tn3 family transposase [Paraburkholderia sp. JHI869]|uniref:Tn3 family transposase n=1 Tax=Paraburkholderia sp. JHI869 TaxID=3112959 RepID=UPI00317AE24C